MIRPQKNMNAHQRSPAENTQSKSPLANKANHPLAPAHSRKTPLWIQHLLHWFSVHQRTMPWRDDPSPYKVWVSEIMLQQTRVTAVIPYFERFLGQFPTVQSLADAPLEKVLKAWEGLGYYSRARNLHQTAKIIHFERNGHFPKTEAEWLALPGVGPYTAAAVASIACGQTAAAIDGNVMRVWSRLRGIREDISTPAWRNKARADLIRYARICNASLFNQAMMELGALVCLPRNPACVDCPIRNNCIAHRKRWTDIIPLRKKINPVPHRHEVVLLISSNKKVLMRQRPEKGLLAGLWKFPSQPLDKTHTSSSRAARALANSLHIPQTNKLQKHQRVEHAFTHFTQTLHVYRMELATAIKLPSPDWRWCSAHDLDTLPLSRSQRIIANEYNAEDERSS